MLTGQAGVRKVDVDGVRLALHTDGSGAPTVVFISGLGDASAVWSAVIEQLAGSGTLVAYDRAGCGESDDIMPPIAAVPRPSSWAARQLHDLLDRADVSRPFVLVGHSLGGQIADAFAIRWPELVAGLVLVDAVDAELNLRIDQPRPTLDDAVPERAGRGWTWDVAASAAEYLAGFPQSRPPTVVVASAIWRWFQAKQPELYRPFSMAEVDQQWQLAQLQYAQRWHGDLVVAHEAGHRVHVEAPGLVAATIAAVVDAAESGQRVQLNHDRLLESGGAVRPTGRPDAPQGARAT